MDYAPGFEFCGGFVRLTYAIVRNLNGKRPLYIKEKPISVSLEYSTISSIHFCGGGVVYASLTEGGRIWMKAVCFSSCTIDDEGNGIASYSVSETQHMFSLVSICDMKTTKGNDCIYTLYGVNVFTDINNSYTEAKKVSSISSNSGISCFVSFNNNFNHTIQNICLNIRYQNSSLFKNNFIEIDQSFENEESGVFYSIQCTSTMDGINFIKNIGKHTGGIDYTIFVKNVFIDEYHQNDILPKELLAGNEINNTFVFIKNNNCHTRTLKKKTVIFKRYILLELLVFKEISSR